MCGSDLFAQTFLTAHHSPCPRLLSHAPLYHARMQTFISAVVTGEKKNMYTNPSLSFPPAKTHNTNLWANLIYSRCLHKKFVCAWLINPLSSRLTDGGGESNQFLCVTDGRAGVFAQAFGSRCASRLITAARSRFVLLISSRTPLHSLPVFFLCCYCYCDI